MLLHTKPTSWSNSTRLSVRPAVPTRLLSRKRLTHKSCHHAPPTYVAFGPRQLVARFTNADGAGDASQETATGDSGTFVPVVFELAKHCPFGHAFALIGDAPQLGQWDVSQALKLEWSEGDVWRACVSLPLDTPVSFKYIQVDGSGRLQGWGQDLAGGSNLSVLVTPSDEVMSGLQLILEPSDAADPSHQPRLAARLDTSAILPESAARFQEAQEANTDQDNTAAADTTTATTATAPAAADTSPEAGVPDAPAFAEADAVMAADELDMQPWAEQQQDEQEEEEVVVTNIGQLQLGDDDQEAAPAADTADGPVLQGWEDEGDEGSVPVVGAVVSAGEESTAESVQQQGLQVEAEAEGGPEGDPLAAAADAELTEKPVAATAGPAGGGVSAGYEGQESVGAAVSAGLMEAGDDETMAEPTGAAALTPTSTPPATHAPSGSITSHMITSMDLEDSETDEAHDNSSSSTENQPAVEAMAATVQESARLASTHHASTDQGADDSRGSLEGLPTPADSNAAAVANTMLGAELVRPFEGAEVCRPPNPYSKLVAATPSVSTVDADAPLLDVSKAVTELDSSSKGVQPVDSYEEAFGALVTAAAAAAVSGSHDGWTAAPQGREGADAAAAERVLRVARADEGAGDAEGTGTWTAEAAGGDAASDETPTADAVDGERTGTWTAEAADADAAAAFGPDSSQPSEHATENADSEGRASLGRKDDSSGSRSKGGNWLQRMLGGGGNEGGRA